MSFTPADIEWLLQRNGAEPGIWLMTIEAVGQETLRYALFDVPVTSRGMVFDAGHFDFEEPEDGDQAGQVRLTVPNINREVGLALLETHERITCHFEMVRQSDPDRVMKAFRALELRDAEITPLTVSGTLSVADLTTEPCGSILVVPAYFPGLFT